MMNRATARREPAPGFANHPDYRVDFEPCAKRVRAVFGGETIACSTRVMLMRETRYMPVYYFPRVDVRMDLLTRTDHSSFCPFKGDASYWTIDAGSQTAENAAWSYEAPYQETAPIKDTMAFYWDRVDAWYEEDEEVFVHARDPHVRIDILDSSRPVRVTLGGETVAETTRARFLFETGLPTRYYIPAADVRMNLLTPSETRTRCPYKGAAVYWSAALGGAAFEDVAWSYPAPLQESARIKNYLCFFDERVDEITVDGAPVEKPKTAWSRGA
jgi:uncharacterized protein (DUF427 family)